MPVLAMALPIPPGKTEALAQHLADAKNHPDLDAPFKGFGMNKFHYLFLLVRTRHINVMTKILNEFYYLTPIHIV